MKLRVRSVALVAAVSLMAGTISAKTVAWYHFNEGDNGTKPTSSGTKVFENAADPGSLMGIPYAMNASSTNTNTSAAYRPAYTNDAPGCETWRWHDPVTGTRGEDPRCLYVKSSNNNGSGQAGVVFVEDDVKLHCPNVTVEFMVKLQPGIYLKNWAHMLVFRSTPMPSNVKAWGMMINSNGTVSVQMHTRNADHNGLVASKSIDSGFYSPSPSVTDGKWHHIAFTYDGSYARIYVDYEQRASKAWTEPIDYSENCEGRLCICCNDVSTYGRWQGFIDEVRISDEALHPSEFIRPGALPEAAARAAKVTDQDTAIYLPFDSAAVCDNTFFGTVGAPIVFNETAASNALFVGATLATDGILPTVETSAIVTNTIHSGIFATESAANDGCWKFGENTTVAGKSVHLTVDDYSMNGNKHLISSGDFTIEFWINVPETPSRTIYVIAEQSATKGPGTLLMYITNSGLMYCRLVSQTALDNYETNNVSLAGNYNDAYVSGIFDGKWHHVALVVDRTRQTATYYVDHAVVRQHTGFVLASSVASVVNHADYKPLQISGGWGANRNDEFHKLSIDELRITRRALAPQEFLMRGENGTTALAPTRAWMDFEGNLAVKPRPDEIMAGTKEDPVAFSSSVPTGRCIIDGNGDVLRASNTNSLKFSGSGNVRFERNILLEREMTSQTIEFFMKGTNGSAKAWAYMARMYTTPTPSDVQGCRVWSIGYSNNAGDLYFCMDTTNTANQVKYFTGSNLDDGRWHHVAFTTEPDGTGNTTVKFYKDYRQFGDAQTITGISQVSLDGGVPSSCLAIGSASYDGWIDEVRITQGVLPVSQMMHVQRYGSVLSLR